MKKAELFKLRILPLLLYASYFPAAFAARSACSGHASSVVLPASCTATVLDQVLFKYSFAT